ETNETVGWFLLVEPHGTYEGAIARTFLRPGEDPHQVCSRCQDDRKNAPLLGLSLVRGMTRQGLKYEDGTIVDPRDGKIYSAIMTLSPDGQTLTLRGYLGIPLLGMDEVWRRLTASALPQRDATVSPKYVPEYGAPAGRPRPDLKSKKDQRGPGDEGGGRPDERRARGPAPAAPPCAIAAVSQRG